jgi:hypothetical protein
MVPLAGDEEKAAWAPFSRLRGSHGDRAVPPFLGAFECGGDDASWWSDAHPSRDRALQRDLQVPACGCCLFERLTGNDHQGQQQADGTQPADESGRKWRPPPGHAALPGPSRERNVTTAMIARFCRRIGQTRPRQTRFNASLILGVDLSRDEDSLPQKRTEHWQHRGLPLPKPATPRHLGKQEPVRSIGEKE